MPLHAARSHEEIIENIQADANTYVELDGDIVPLPENHAANQYFSEIDDFGDAAGYPFAHVPQADGYMIGVSKVNGSEASITFQNLSSLSKDRPGYLQAQPIIEGRKPIRNPEHAAKLPRPTLPPRVALEDAPRAGFPAGTTASPHAWCYTFYDPETGLETDPSSEVTFTCGFGQALKFTIPEVPEGLLVGIYLKLNGKGVPRRQRLWDPRNGVYTHSGPFRYGRRVPTRNETYLGAPAEVRLGKQVKRDRYHAGDLSAGEWRFFVTEHTVYGESPSSISRSSRIVQGEIFSQPIPDTNPPEYRAVDTGKVEKSAWWVARPKRRRGAKGWSLYVQILRAADQTPTTYKVVFTNKIGRPTTYFPYSGRKAPVPVTGDAVQRRLGAPGEARFFLFQQEPPTEDTTGIEGPTTAPEPAVGVLTSFPAAGTLKVLYAPTSGEEVGLPSPVATIVVPAGKIVRVTPPVSVNLIPNAEGTEQDSSGTPFDVTVSRTNGTYSCEDGVHKLATNGAVADTSGTPTATFMRQEVSPDRLFSVTGKIKVVAVAGTGRFFIRQYRADNTFAVTTLADIGATDYREASQRLVLNADTVAVEPWIAMSGVTRNMTVEVWDFGLFALPYVPPKFLSAKEGSREPANFEPPADTPYPDGTVWGTGPAPGPVVVEPQAPLSTLTFDDNPALTNGTVYQGWVVTTNLATLEVRADAGIDGPYGVRVKDTTQTSSGSTARLHQVFTGYTGNSMGLRLKLRCRQKPTWAGSSVVLAEIKNANNTRTLGYVRHRADGALILVALDRVGSIVAERTIADFVGGETVDLEIIATSAGTTSGVLDALVGKNGAKRNVVVSISAINWNGVLPAQAVAMFVRETDVRATSEHDIDSIVATRRGDVIEDSRPPSTQTFVPDAPTRADGTPILFGQDEERINRMALFVHPEQPEAPVGLQDVSICAVKPGRTYSAALRGRWGMSPDSEPWFPWFLYLANAKGEVYDVGSLHGAAGCAGESGWTDLAIAPFVVPEEFTELRATFRGFPQGGGLFLYHGPLRVSEGVVPKEGHGRAASTTFSLLIDTRTPLGDAYGLPFKDGWISFGVAPADVPDGTSVSARYRSTNDPSGLAYPTGWQTDKALVGHADLLDIEATLSTAVDGKTYPRIPMKGLAVQSAPFDAQLLRADRSELPGGSVISGLENYFERSDKAIRTVAGRVRSTPTTGSVKRLPRFKLQVFTEDAARELESDKWLQEDWIIESPTHDGAGIVLTIRNTAEIDVADSNGAHVAGGVRYVYGVAEVAGAEVLEVAPLIPTP